MSNPDSEQNKKAILADLESVKITPQYDYEKLSSTKEFFVQPEGDLCEAYCAKLQLVAGKPEIVDSVDSAFSRIKEIIGDDVLLCNNPDLLKILDEKGMTYNIQPFFHWQGGRLFRQRNDRLC